VEFALGFLLAIALNRKIGFERIVKSLILLPLAVSPVAAGALWRVMFSPLYGVIDYFLVLLGIPAQPWASSVSQALLSVEIVDIWQWTPFMALILLSGLASLSGEVLEAASIDGAGAANTFFNIVLPLMRNVILIAVVLRIMDAIKVFDVIFSLTWGGPGNATTLITRYLSITAFSYWELGLAAAESFVTVTMISFIIVLFIRLVRETRVEKTI
jgi:multiple sugar transport system permease protein